MSTFTFKFNAKALRACDPVCAREVIALAAGEAVGGMGIAVIIVT